MRLIVFSTLGGRFLYVNPERVAWVAADEPGHTQIWFSARENADSGEADYVLVAEGVDDVVAQLANEED